MFINSIAEQADLQQAEIPTEDLAEAEKKALDARKEFTEMAEKFGRKVALRYFNARVLRWAKGFSNPRLGRVMYIVGTAMSGETHSYAITVNGRIGSGTKGARHRVAKGSLLEHYYKAYARTEYRISYRQFYRYLEIARREKIIDRIPAEERQGESEPHPGAWRPTMTHVNFWLVLKDGQVIPHDFEAPLENLPELPEEPAQAKNDTRHGTGDGTGHDTGHDTQPTLPLSSNEPSSPSSEEDELSLKREDEDEDLTTVGGRLRARRRKDLAQHQGQVCEFCTSPATKRTRRPPYRYCCRDHDDDLPEYTWPIESDAPDLADLSDLRGLGSRSGSGRSRKSGVVENEYYVYPDGKFYKCSKHTPQRRGPEPKRVSLTKNQGVFLWRDLKKFGSAPNKHQQAYMAMKAGWRKVLPPGFPTPPIG